MQEKILGIIENFLKLDHQTLLDNLENKEIWDSLIRVEILFAIEDEFDISFEEEELSQISTPASLCNLVKCKVE